MLRLGTHAEKDYFEKLGSLFDGIIVGANLVESTPGATASLLLGLGGAKRKLAYYIDPMTYAYGSYSDPKSGQVREDLDWIKSEQQVRKNKKKTTVRDFKRSYKGLAGAYGLQFGVALEKSKAVSWQDLDTPAKQEALVQSVIQYQMTRLQLEFEKDPEFKQYGLDVPSPAAVFAPYFYCERDSIEDWLSLNIALAERAAKLQVTVPVHAVFCTDPCVLSNAEQLTRCIDAFGGAGVKAVWLWFSALAEDVASVEDLQAVRRVVEGLNARGLEVYNLHGGFFSLALSKYGMTGISHGVGYGEQKDVVPVIGQTVPTVRYYLPALHTRLGVADIERCFDTLGIRTPADFYTKVCDCVVCKGIVLNDLREFGAFGESKRSASKGLRLVQTPAAARRCRFHFLLTRIREAQEMGDLTVAAIRASLDGASATWGAQPWLARSSRHLRRWVDALG